MITWQSMWHRAFNQFILMNDNPSVNPTPNDAPFHTPCAYLTPDGRRCAVGLSLPDDVARESEGMSLGGVVSLFPHLFAPEVLRNTNDKQSRFQARLHDSHVDCFRFRWGYSRTTRYGDYIMMAHQLGVDRQQSHDKATRWTSEQADKIVADLMFGELDGWTYNKENAGDGLYLISVFDENSEFVAFFNHP